MTAKKLRPQLIDALRKVRKLEYAEAKRQGLGFKERFLDCDVVCEMMQPLLRRKGIIGKIEVEEGHSWIKVGDLFVDPTADQFRLPKIRKYRGIFK